MEFFKILNFFLDFLKTCKIIRWAEVRIGNFRIGQHQGIRNLQNLPVGTAGVDEATGLVWQTKVYRSLQ